MIQPLALGGITYGVSDLELTAAYAAIADGGQYRKPVFYTKVTDSKGNVLIDNTENKATQVFKASTASLLTNAMEDVLEKGTGVAARLDNMHAAGKTGTTNEAKDLVFAGFTPYYTAAIWATYDTHAEFPESDREFHKRLWAKVMNEIHEALRYGFRNFRNSTGGNDLYEDRPARPLKLPVHHRILCGIRSADRALQGPLHRAGLNTDADQNPFCSINSAGNPDTDGGTAGNSGSARNTCRSAF